MDYIRYKGDFGVIKRTFDLNIESVLENWSVADAIREIIANAEDETIITSAKPVEIYKSNDGKWHIKDYGRGLKYLHFTQNESEEKLSRKDLIGKFGVGLKDALATFHRHNVNVTIKTKDATIKTVMASKHGFSDVETLHAEIIEIEDSDTLGTEFILENCSDEDMKKAKSNFIKYTDSELLENTRYGEVYKKAKVGEKSNIYVNGMKIAQEENFVFHYNITNINASIKKALNRERANVGRSAYTERVKQILLSSSNEEVLNVMMEQLERVSYGNNCDEISWLDVATHMAKQVNKQGNIVFLPQGNYVSEDMRNIIKSEGKKIIYVPENIAVKFEDMKDDNGDQMGTLSSFMKSHEENFEFDFVKYKDLSKEEQKVYDLCERIAKELQFDTLLKRIKISNTMHKSLEENILGVCDHKSDMIVIKRSQLKCPEEFLGTLLHEVIHYKTHQLDCTRAFENELTKTIGILACRLVESNTRPNNRWILSLFKAKEKNSNNT